jgi:hypothetical protein
VEVLGNAKGKPRSGAFEVTSEDGTVYWSKLGIPPAPPLSSCLKLYVGCSGGLGFPTPAKLIAVMAKGKEKDKEK